MTSPISFQLLAPNNPEVSLLGNWDGWQPFIMRRGEDGMWRAEVPLEDGDYEYLFEVVSCSEQLQGRKIRVPDPCALEWTREDKTRLHIRNGAIVHAEYTWQYEDAQLPPNENLIIYELHIGDFSGGEGDEKPGGGAGTLQDAIDKLDYLVDLGINAIELMPLTAGPPGHQMGYSQRTFFALNESYGTPTDFARFVDECHARGIRVIHDSVYNHTATDAIWALIDFDHWYFKINPDDFDFGPKLNYDAVDPRSGKQYVREYAFESMRLWMQEFHLDGIRFDYARALSPEVLGEFRALLRKAAAPRNFFAIAEHIPENPSIVGPQAPTDAAWSQSILTQVLCTALGKPHRDQRPFHMEALNVALDWRVCGYQSAHHIITYLESHDEPRIMTIFDDNPNLTREARFRRAKLAAALLLTAPGIPMLWMGQEFGEEGRKPELPQPLRWRLLQQSDHRDLWEYYRKLIRLRKENPALTSNTLHLFPPDQNDLVLHFLRWSEDKRHQVLVIANVQDAPLQSHEFDTARLAEGSWRDALTGREFTFTQSPVTIDLAPSQVMILCHSTQPYTPRPV
jgi:1,4-alpha-glucan branching enzyme